MKTSGRASLNLKSSICTDNPTGSDTYPFDDQPTQVVQHTGMERNGGITSFYEQETTFITAGANSIITNDGSLLQVDSSNNVRLNNNVIGNVGPYTVFRRGALAGVYLDAAWTTTGTIIGIKKAGNVITVDEYDPATTTVTNTRNITFAGMPASPLLAITLIKFVDMTYAANQEFLVTQGSGSLFTYVLKESGTTVTSTVLTKVPWGWRFATGKYILWDQGTTDVANTHCWIGDVGAYSDLGISATCRVKWVTIDRYNGTSDSRAILVYNTVEKNAANMFTGYGIVGYNGSGVYSATPTYFGIALGAVTATVSNPISGPGYIECTFTRSDTGSNVYYYVAPDFEHSGADPGWLTAQVFTGTNPKINAYGKLTDIHVAVANNSFLTSIRCCMVNDQPSYLSAAPITSGTTTKDHLGIPLTNVGEFDEAFPTHIVDNNSTFTKILYRYNGRIFFIDIRSGQAHLIYRVSNTIYEINCISPVNVVDTEMGNLNLGGTDYNGRFICTATGTGTGGVWVATMKSPYANSVDFGVKFCQTYTGTTLGITLSLIPGIEIPTFIDRAILYEVDFYQGTGGGVYVSSCSLSTPNTSSFIDINKIGILYVSDTRLPIGMGYSFADKVAFTEIETLFLGVGVSGTPDIDYDYVGYELGNDLLGIFQGFYLFGQRYLFDGFQIWLATFNGSLYANKLFMTYCLGMQFVAVSPTEAFFLSQFDTSLYSFNGGRSLIKGKRMNDLRNSSNVIESITGAGIFNVRDNSLLIQTASTFVWVRDGVVTQNNKKANQTGISLFDTQRGIVIANNTLSWNYSFLNNGTVTTTGGSAVSAPVGLTWQSAYHSLKGNELSIAMAWIVTLFSPDGAQAVPVTLRCHAFDQDRYTLQREDITVQPSDWDGLGFIRLRIQPKNEKALASSLQIDTTKHVVITDVTVLYGDEAQAPTASARSK